jgi:hypothetical protein
MPAPVYSEFNRFLVPEVPWTTSTKMPDFFLSVAEGKVELTEFQTQALARLAAQHDEIIRLRAAATSASRVSRLPQRAATIGSCN